MPILNELADAEWRGGQNRGVFMRLIVSALRSATFTFMIALAATSAQASEYPDRPITLVVPGSPGGTTDFFGRVYAEGLAAELNSPVVVVNRPTGLGIVGLESVATAKADGYTLLFAGGDAMILIPLMLKKTSFDAVTSFTPLAKVGGVDIMIAVHPSVPVTSIGELVGYARSKPGAIRFGTGSVGSLAHVAIEWLKQHEGLQMEHIGYRGGSAAAIAALTGEVEMLGAAGPTIARLGEGKLKPLAVTGAMRLRSAPNVPTLRESGYPDLLATAWFGLLGPAQLPADIVGRLTEATRKVVANAEFQKRSLAVGSEEAGLLTGAEFGRYIAADRERWRAVVQNAQIKPE